MAAGLTSWHPPEFLEPLEQQLGLAGLGKILTGVELRHPDHHPDPVADGEHPQVEIAAARGRAHECVEPRRHTVENDVPRR